MEIKINTIIDALKEYIEAKGGIPLTGNIILNKKELLDYIDDIKNELPISVNEASKIYEEREKILNDANKRDSDSLASAEARAMQIISDAEHEASILLDKNEITKNARIKADEIIEEANQKAFEILEIARIDSDSMKTQTFDFVDEKIANLDSIYSHAKYNSEYLREEFNKHAGKLFHILLTNIEKDHEDIVANKNAFLEYREDFLANQKDSNEADN